MRRFSLLVLLLLLPAGTSAYAQYTKSNPSSAEDYVARGNMRHFKGDTDGALADSTKAIEIDPERATSYNARGDLRDARGDHDGAVADYTKAIEINSAYAKAYENSGLVKLRQGKGTEAQRDFDTALKLDPRLKTQLEKAINDIKQSRAVTTKL
jgi:tetratricopeptide (TPR) repeat protein